MYLLYVTVTDKMGPDAAKNVTEKKITTSCQVFFNNAFFFLVKKSNIFMYTLKMKIISLK